MKEATLPVPEIGLIAATRGMAGAGAALLLADRLSPKSKKMLGWPLFLVGALSTVPILIDVMRRSGRTNGDPIATPPPTSPL
ncbi:MAG TPA: hypothetical protein VKT78_20620 [Fimbriimonadaceae bacterium]|nr:hypothetical protein [Fimbriimonadaceae bacterium]